MFSYCKLYDRVFDKNVDADKLVIITGYIGTAIVSDLEDLPYNTEIYIGMYGSNIGGIIHSSLLELNKSKKININYTNMLVHSKCYIWLKNNQIVKALIGSANFSSLALMTPLREVLGDIPTSSYEQLQVYMNLIMDDSYSVDKYTGNITRVSYIDEFTKSISEKEVEISLLASKDGSANIIEEVTVTGDVPKGAGLNWGFSNALPSPNDAYIAIPSELIRNNPILFPPKSEDYNEYIDAIWDDGTQMQMLMEGKQTIDGIDYPKQIGSYKSKKVLGIYLRDRIGKKIGKDLILEEETKEELRKNVKNNYAKYKEKLITKEMLEEYGRNSINIKLLGEGTYYFDFSSDKKEDENEQ